MFSVYEVSDWRHSLSPDLWWLLFDFRNHSIKRLDDKEDFLSYVDVSISLYFYSLIDRYHEEEHREWCCKDKVSNCLKCAVIQSLQESSFRSDRYFPAIIGKRVVSDPYVFIYRPTASVTFVARDMKRDVWFAGKRNKKGELKVFTYKADDLRYMVFEKVFKGIV